MKVLVDTHVFLWAYASRERLNPAVQSLLLNESVEKYFSAASAWEIIVKWGRGALELPDHPVSLVPLKVAEAGMHNLAITLHDVLKVSELPAIHKDPFDRLLIAQALRHGAKILTMDKVIAEYDVEVIALWLNEDDD